MAAEDDSGGGGGERLAKNRIEAFSDGVFAIAITLLVLGLSVKDGLDHGAFVAAIRALAPKLSAYALSFAILGVYWVAHHLMLGAARYVDRTLLWINNLFLLFVTTVPFSAGLLGGYPREPLAAILYGLNLVAASSTLLALFRYITDVVGPDGRRRLAPADLNPALVRDGVRRNTLAIGVYLLALLLAPWDTRVSIAIYWTVPLGYIVTQAHLDRKRFGP